MKKVILGIMMAMLIVLSVMPSTLAVNSVGVDKRVTAEYQETKSQYLAAKSSYQTVKQNFVTARQKWQQFKGAEETEELIDKAQDFLLKGANVMIRHLEFVKIRVENHENMDDQEEILAEIDDLIAKTTNLKDEINVAETKDDIKTIAKKVKDSWIAHKKYVKKYTGLLLNGKITNNINKMESFINRLDSKVQELKEEGYDVSSAEAKIEDLNENLAIAKQKHESAKAKFNKIDSVSDADKLFREGHAFVKEANNYLKESYTEIREIVKDLRTQIRSQNSGGDEE